MGPLGAPELIALLIIVLLVFGAKRLPDLGRSLGSGMREFKSAVTGKDHDEESERGTLAEGPAPAPAAQNTQQTQREDAPAQPRA